MTVSRSAESQSAEGRYLSQEEAEALAARLANLARGGGTTVPTITSWWNGELRWARNRVALAADRRDINITVRRVINGSLGQASTNQIDDVSLEGVVRAAERSAQLRPDFVAPEGVFRPSIPALSFPQTAVWSEATYNQTAAERAELAQKLVVDAEAKGLLSAGYIEVRAGSVFRPINGAPRYDRYTQAQCSMTVRDQQGTGSGWAGLSSYDWAKIDGPKLAARALDKCVTSRNPVALEPGRYTAILEPQATADIVEMLVQSEDEGWKSLFFGRQEAESSSGNHFALPGNWKFPTRSGTLRLGKAALGRKVADERLTLSHDPKDPDLGVIPEPGMEPVTWIDHGVLTNLVYSREYGITELGKDSPVRGPQVGYRLSGGNTSVEEMIATTQRGVLVTRLWDIQPLNTQRTIVGGLTRDGIWLIENGKITKPVKNFWFVEAPLSLLNRVEQMGVSVPVFRPVRDPYHGGRMVDSWYSGYVTPVLTPAVVPALKIRDFNFTALADAV